MIERLRPGQIELKVHGLTSDDHGRVPARVFANKLKQLVGALEAADAMANGRISHSYILASMHMSQPTAVLAEVPLDDCDVVGESAIPVFAKAVEAIKFGSSYDGNIDHFTNKVGLLASGVEKKFGFVEVSTAGDNVIRIDEFLRSRISKSKKVTTHPWFSGVVDASFDGVLNYVDARGNIPQIKLTMTAGGREIDCVCRRSDIDTLGDVFDKRVRVYGRAIYEGHSPLPVRVEVRLIELVKAPGDFSRWKGAFAPFEADSWGYDE